MSGVGYVERAAGPGAAVVADGFNDEHVVLDAGTGKGF
jgi:hypothetical protein